MMIAVVGTSLLRAMLARTVQEHNPSLSTRGNEMAIGRLPTRINVKTLVVLIVLAGLGREGRLHILI
jgi:hypothetical protein